MIKIFLLEDSPPLAARITAALNEAGFAVTAFSLALPFLDALENEKPALIILEINFQGTDSMQILHQIREQFPIGCPPVLLCSSRLGRLCRIEPLADPVACFDTEVLVQKVRKMTHTDVTPHTAYTYKSLRADSEAMKLTVGDASFPLSPKEYALLSLLMENAGKPVTRKMICERLWHSDEPPAAREIDVYIRMLRKKMGDYAKAITTIRGTGYRFQ